MDMSLKLASSYFDMLKSLSDEAKLHLIKMLTMFLPSWRNCLNWHITFGGLGTMKLLNCLKTLTLLCGKKLVITPSFCWKE